MARRVEGTVKCPKCGAHTFSYDGGHLANVCVVRACGHMEPVEQPKPMTKWDIIDLVRTDRDVQNAILRLISEEY